MTCFVHSFRPGEVNQIQFRAPDDVAARLHSNTSASAAFAEGGYKPTFLDSIIIENMQCERDDWVFMAVSLRAHMPCIITGELRVLRHLT